MRLAVLTGLYVGVVVMAQVGTNKIVDVPLTNLTAGTHTIQGEFVAVDHQPFKNRPVVSVVFTVKA